MLKIGKCVGCMMRNSSYAAKVKGSKVKVTRSNDNDAQKHMPQTLSDSGNIPVLYEIVVAEHDGDGKQY